MLNFIFKTVWFNEGLLDISLLVIVLAVEFELESHKVVSLFNLISLEDDIHEQEVQVLEHS